MLYDLFICHAAEDKADFVRPLAQALRTANVSVWYDEFTLTLGDSIRRAIDEGLARSRFGVVVLSESFFSKSWPQYELDGLAELQASDHARVILPIWHGVSKDQVLRFSPPLANRFAAQSSDGVDSIVSQIVDVVHPAGSPLVEAWRKAQATGLNPPSVTDAYWLRVVEASNRVPGFGAVVPEESSWTTWSFPLPGGRESAEAWGHLLSATAAQLEWVEAADRDNICVVTRPDTVHDFIQSHAGLLETCTAYPRLTAEYAPQLTIPTFSGPLHDAFTAALQRSREAASQRARTSPRSGTALTVDGLPPTCDEEWCLRDEAFGGYRASTVANAYFAGSMFGPMVSPWEHADHLIWLLSDESSWLPPPVRTVLTDGMRDWTVWTWTGWSQHSGHDGSHAGALFTRMHDAVEDEEFRWDRDARADLLGRVQLASERLDLPESAQLLAERFIQGRFVEGWLARTRQRDEEGA